MVGVLGPSLPALLVRCTPGDSAQGKSAPITIVRKI